MSTERIIQAEPVTYESINTIITDNMYITSIPSNSRQKFIIKVYNTLCLQLLITSILISISLKVDIINSFIKSDISNMLLPLFITILFIYHCIFRCFYESCNISPWKEIYIILVTILSSYILSYITVNYDIQSILIAVIITIVSVIGLTLYSYQTIYDNNIYGSIIILCLINGITLLYISLYSNWYITHYIFSILGSLIFGIFIVYDTYLILNGKHTIQFKENDIILTTTTLYWDIINYFLCMLRIVKD